MPTTTTARRRTAAALLAAVALTACRRPPADTPAQAAPPPEETPEQVARDFAAAACDNNVDRVMGLLGGRLATLERESWEQFVGLLSDEGCTDELVSVTPTGSGGGQPTYLLYFDLPDIYYDWAVTVGRLDAQGWAVTAISE